MRREEIYPIMEGISDFILSTDGREIVTYVSPLMKSVFFSMVEGPAGSPLEQLLSPDSIRSFRKAMKDAAGGTAGTVAMFSASEGGTVPMPMKTAYTGSIPGGLYLFAGMQSGALESMADWEKEERAKELSCLYSVAEWIEVSKTIHEFFSKLPLFLVEGMKYPVEARVYSVYQETEYGDDLPRDDSISVKLLVSGDLKGRISVGYPDSSREILPEEQKMLNEIGRMLSLALERKELRERIALKRDEEQEYSARLRELERKITAREQELLDQKKRLSTVDSYLDRVNETMEESSRRLETMFKAIPDKVLLIDLDHNVVMSNRDGIEPRQKCFKACFNRDRPCTDCRLKRIVRNKTPITVTIQDDDRYLEVHALPVYSRNEEVEGILEFYRDITLEKTYEQQIQQADKLASLGQLVSGIGHEINNPNQFIRGNIKIVKQALEDMLPIMDEYRAAHPDLKIARLKYDFFREHIMTLVDDMAHGSERIKGIVEGLRGFARKDDGLLVDSVDINTLIAATGRLVQNEVHKRGELILKLGDDVRQFRGNSQKIEQVLINLIVNAAQAIPDDRKGLITVRTSMEGDAVKVEIIDNGKGIDEKTQKQIFDPFFTTKRAKGGTGLGLAIAYRIVEEHRGKIMVASTPGEGTVFTISIPAPGGD